MKRSLPLFAALLCLPGLASAHDWRSYFHAAAAPAAAPACPTVAPVVIGGTQGYADSLGNGRCFVSIHPMASDMVYRDYAFFDDGMMMVFNSYGAAEGPTMTSARSFYFFPRRGPAELEMDPKSGTVAVAMADGGRAFFDPPTAQVKSLERGTVTVSPSLDRAARGGVEIPSYNGLLLDAGFRLGELPAGRPKATSVFRDAAGRTCAVTNDEIFSYAGGDPALKYDDAALSAFLKTRCPALAVGF